jgi:hypothetical protein
MFRDRVALFFHRNPLVGNAENDKKSGCLPLYSKDMGFIF